MPDLDLAADLDLLVEAATEAGEIARRFWRNDPKVWQKEAGQGPVTEADLASDASLRARLLAARPSYGWLSEESAGSVGDGPTFIVDPIDGTRAFAAGERTWAVSVAIAVAGVPVAGAVVLPEREKTYAAAQGQGATLNREPLQASPRDALDGADILASKPALRDEHWRDGAPDVSRHFRTSLAYRLALVGEGRFDGMLTLRPTWVWDVAAGLLIATEGGAAVTDRRGAPLSLSEPEAQVDGIIAAAPGVHRGILAALA